LLLRDRLAVAFYAISILLIAGFVLEITSSFTIPFVMALILYLLASPLIDRLERKRIPHWVAILMVGLLSAGVVTLLGLLAYSSVETLAQGLPRYQHRYQQILSFFTQFAKKYPMLKLEQIPSTLNLTDISSLLLSTIGSFMKFITGLTLMFLFFFFMLVGKGSLERKLEKIYRGRRAERIHRISKEVEEKVYKYLWTKTLISLITGFNTWLILLLFGVDFAFVWGFLTFVFNYIPNVGPIFITIPPLIIALLKFGKLLPVLALLILLALNHMVMGNFVEPRWMGKTLNLSPLLVLFSLIFWGWLWGVVGMLLSVPILSIIKIILESFSETEKIARLMEG